MTIEEYTETKEYDGDQNSSGDTNNFVDINLKRKDDDRYEADRCFECGKYGEVEYKRIPHSKPEEEGLVELMDEPVPLCQKCLFKKEHNEGHVLDKPAIGWVPEDRGLLTDYPTNR